MVDPFLLSRRRALALGAAGLLAPPRLLAQPATGFTHGVASGEPGARQMLFWTRFVGAGDRPVPLRLELFTSPRMTRAVARAEALAAPETDWCAKVTVGGLSPGTTYYYRFTGPDRQRSILGRTRTLPEDDVRQFRLALFSCSNLPYGWFNAYGATVAADDVDLFVHVGDYLYEYERGRYPPPAEAVPGRVIEPEGELVRLADYRARYASYRLDPDLQALHARFPAILAWDDHESANDAWTGGAENHQPDREGPWAERLAVARRVHREWMPVSDAPYARYRVGRLLALHRLDTRVEGRDRQLDLASFVQSAGGELRQALLRFRDEEWMRGSRQLLGLAQEKWLFQALDQGRAEGVRWQVLAQQVLMGQLKAPSEPSALPLQGVRPELQGFLKLAAAAAAVGLPLNMDAWDGYPAARARLLSMAQRAGANLVVLSGDSHNAWAFELANDGRPAGVEFGGPSVSSPGFESELPLPPPDVARALVAANPQLKWCETSRRGYVHVTFTPEAAVAEYRFTGPTGVRSPRLAMVQRATVRPGTLRLELA